MTITVDYVDSTVTPYSTRGWRFYINTLKKFYGCVTRHEEKHESDAVKIYFSLLNLRVRTYLLLYIIVNIFIFWFENYVKDYPPFSQQDQVEGGVGWREMEVGWGREGGVAVMGLKGKLMSCNVTLSNSSLSLIFSSDQRRRLCKILEINIIIFYSSVIRSKKNCSRNEKQTNKQTKTKQYRTEKKRVKWKWAHLVSNLRNCLKIWSRGENPRYFWIVTFFF